MQIIRDTSAITPEPCVATIGFFDGVHAGHRYLIQQVKEIAAAKGLRSALVTFPVHPRKVMNVEYRPELLTTPEEKISLLADIGVDYCLMLDFTPEISRLTAREFMTQLLKERYQVKYLVIGYDHRFGHNRSEGFEDYVRYGKEIGIEVIRAKAYTSNIEIGNEPNIPVSSSLIRKLLHEGEVSLAAHCLKYEYFLDGIVVGGYQVGRKIGFPTANLRVDDPDKLIPADGVYAVWVTFDGKTYMGMLNIGVRPTIDNGPNRTIEVNILHFHSDIYDKFIRLTFVKRTRPELKFSSIDELITQLHKDAEETETILKAYEKLPTLKKEKYFRTWITRILINECKGILRKRKNVIPYEEYMDNMKMTEEDRYSHLYMAIMVLPEDLRVLVTLYYLEGFSLKEISEALDIPEGTIKSRLSRAREFLKAQLSDEEEKRPMPGKNSKLSKRITGKGKMSC